MDVRSAARAGLAGVCAVGWLAQGTPAQAVGFTYSGYVRQHLSVNLQDAPERANPIRPGEFLGASTRDSPVAAHSASTPAT